MKLIKLTYILLLIILAAGCTSDNQPDSGGVPQETKVSFSLSTRSNMGDNEGVYEAATLSSELINSYKVIVVDASTREIKAVVEKSLSNPTDEDFFSLAVSAGIYDIYAIANMSDMSNMSNMSDMREGSGSEVKDFFEKAAVVGTVSDDAVITAPSDAVIKSAVWNFASPDISMEVSPLVPMAGFLNNVSLSGTSDSFEIEVVRLYAKIEFKMGLAPGTTKSATVKKIELLDAMTGPVLFMPLYSNLGVSPESHLDGLPFVRGSLAMEPNQVLPIPEASATATVHETVAQTYLREMIAPANAANAFVLRVTIERGGTTKSEDAESGSGSESQADETEIVQYALADELQWINRNDHVIIPITITDWILDVKVNFYPPIGGYPAVLTEKIDDNHVSATFGTQGSFIITPVLTRAGDTRQLSYEEGEYDIVSVETDNLSLFTTKPTFNPLTGEITGELSSGTGTAKVTLRVSVDNVTFTKIIYIIRKN